jgi:hypothetical protein
MPNNNNTNHRNDNDLNLNDIYQQADMITTLLFDPKTKDDHKPALVSRFNQLTQLRDKLIAKR